MSYGHHLQLFNIGGIELLSLLQQVVDIHTQGGRNLTAVGVIAETRLPEYEEVFTLLHAPERPLGIVAQHVVDTLLKTFVPRSRADVLVEILHL